MSGTDHGSSVFQAAECQISIRTGPELSPKLTRECKAVETAENLKLFGSDDPIIMGIQKLARALDGSEAGRDTRSVRSRSIERQERFRNRQHDLIQLQCLKASNQIVERKPKRLHQTRIAQDRVADKWQGSALLAERVPNEVWLDVEHPVAKSCTCPRPPIVYLVGMQDDHVSPDAVGSAAAVIEGLHAVHGIAHCVSVVPVRVIGVARKECLDPLQACLRHREADPIVGRSAARSFKTSPGAWVQNRVHELPY
jgi:hypothetical protein